MRINKFLSHCGVCSRRQADALIEQDVVTIDGELAKCGDVVNLSQSVVMVRGEIVKPAQAKQLYAYHKPAGVIVSTRDPLGRTTLTQALKQHFDHHIIAVGRLDINTEGLLLLTNDGDYARELELPSTNLARCYKVRVNGILDEKKLQALTDGVIVDGIKYKDLKINILKEGKQHNHWIEIILYEGKNREIRKLMDHIGLRVSRLIRLSYGKFKLGDLEVGQVRKII